jgi:enamine deaminase RidA (YjgF/YER057c/UK114 family)
MLCALPVDDVTSVRHGPYETAGQLIGDGDVEVQARAALANLRTALEGAGASFKDLVKLTSYVVGYDQSMAPRLGPIFAVSEDPPAVTWVGVAALGRDEMLNEVDAIAVLD